MSSLMTEEDESAKFFCSDCNCQLGGVSSWLDHLKSECHQGQQRKNGQKAVLLKWGSEGRTLLIRGINGVPAHLVLDYFNKWGHVQNFSYLSKTDGGTQLCYILMKDIEAVNKIMENEAHKIGTLPISIRVAADPQQPIKTNKVRDPVSLGNKIGDNERQGGKQADGTFYCKLCDLSIQFNSFWNAHLTSDSHQDKHRKSQWIRKTVWNLDRQIELKRTVGLTSMAILEFVTSKGHVEDFCYLNRKDGCGEYCNALLQSRELAEGLAGEHMIGDKSVLITLLDPKMKVKYAKWGLKRNAVGATQEASNKKAKTEEESKEISKEPTKPSVHPLPLAEITIEDSDHEQELLNGGKTETVVKEETHNCLTCNFEVKTDDKWLVHLSSPAHQKAKLSQGTSPELAFKSWDRSSAISLRQINNLPSIEILVWAASFGQIADYIPLAAASKKIPDCCYILFKSQKTVKNILEKKNTLKIGTTNVSAFPLLDAAKSDTSSNQNSIPTTSVATFNNQKASASTIKVSQNQKIGSEDQLAALTKALEGAEKMETQIQRFLDTVCWSEDFIKESLHLVNCQLSDIKNRTAFLKQIPLQPFGSLLTKTGIFSNNPNDAHIQLLLDFSETLSKTAESSSSVLNSRVDNLKWGIELCSKSEVFHPSEIKVNTFVSSDGSTVPELCFINRGNGQRRFSIRFGNLAPLIHSRLFEFYFKLDIRAHPLSMLIIFWCQTHSALQVTSQLFDNEIILLFIITFLQSKKILPSVDKLQKTETETKPILINGTNVAFCSDLEIIPPNPPGMLSDESINALSILGLLQEFFNFYASADLAKNSICTRFGMLIPKADFLPDNVGNLPGELCRQYRFGGILNAQGQRGKFINSETPLCVQDPFDLAANLTKSVKVEVADRFQKLCKVAAEKVKEMMMQDHPNIINLFIKTDEPDIMTTSSTTVDGPPPKKLKFSYEGDVGPMASSSNTNTISAMSPIKKKEGEVIAEIDLIESDNDDEEVRDEDIEGGEELESHLGVNGPLYEYFNHGTSGRGISEEDKWLKLQLLAMQIILEFNSQFFSNCFGLVFEPKVGQKFFPSDWAQILETKGEFTVKERLSQVTTEEKIISLQFRVRSDKNIHRLLVENPEKLTMKQLKQGQLKKELTWLMYNESTTGLDIDQVKQESFIPVGPKDAIELRGELNLAISSFSKCPHKPVDLAKVKLCVVGGGEKAEAKLRLIKQLYHNLGQKFINVKVKQWIGNASDFDRDKADRLQNIKHQKWNAKSNKRVRQRGKRAKKQNDGIGRPLPQAPKGQGQNQARPNTNNNFGGGNSFGIPQGPKVQVRSISNIGVNPLAKQFTPPTATITNPRVNTGGGPLGVGSRPRPLFPGMRSRASGREMLVPQRNQNRFGVPVTSTSGLLGHPPRVSYGPPKPVPKKEPQPLMRVATTAPRNFQEYQHMQQLEHNRALSSHSSSSNNMQSKHGPQFDDDDDYDIKFSAPLPVSSTRNMQGQRTQFNVKYEPAMEMQFERRPTPLMANPIKLSPLGRGRGGPISSNAIGYESRLARSPSPERRRRQGYETAGGPIKREMEEDNYARYESRREMMEEDDGNSGMLRWQTRDQYAGNTRGGNSSSSYNFREGASPQQGYPFSPQGFNVSRSRGRGLVSPRQLQGFGISPGGYQGMSSSSSHFNQQEQEGRYYIDTSGNGAGGQQGLPQSSSYVPIYPRRF